jgi:hypothetical protein
MNQDPYIYWRIALSNPDQQAPPANPQPGFWRMDAGKGAPVAIWYDGDALECLVDSEDAHAPLAWRFCAKHPVTEEQYQQRMGTGMWHDDPRQQARTKAPPLNPPPAKDPPVKPDKIDQPPIKNQPDLDGFDAIRFELEAEVETAEELLKQPVKDQEQADRVGVWAKKLGEIFARAEARRVVEKEPHLTASRDVDTKWKPVLNQATYVAQALKSHLQTFLMLKQAGERKRAEEEAAKAQAAWDAAQKIEDEGERAKVVAEAQAAEEASIAKKATAGRTGMKVGLRTEKKARIVDYAKCLAAVSEHPDVKALVETLAQRSVRGGNPLPGVEVVTVEKVV